MYYIDFSKHRNKPAQHFLAALHALQKILQSLVPQGSKERMPSSRITKMLSPIPLIRER